MRILIGFFYSVLYWPERNGATIFNSFAYAVTA
jgi:hypothetical protein